MKTTIKNLLFKKRFKVLKSKKGFSLMEVMVAVGIIGLVSAFALPQYASYQRTVKYGIVRSMLAIPYRAAQIEESMGNGVTNLSSNFLWDKVQSKAKASFTPTFTQNTTDNTKWCLSIQGGGGDYGDFSGCVDEGGVSIIGGKDVPCEKLKSFRKKGTAPPCSDTPCPPGCDVSMAHHTACAALSANSTEEKACKKGANSAHATGVLTASCSGGACSR